MRFATHYKSFFFQIRAQAARRPLVLTHRRRAKDWITEQRPAMAAKDGSSAAQWAAPALALLYETRLKKAFSCR
jgi:hypothetical protein